MPSGIDDVSIIIRSSQFTGNESLDNIINDIKQQIEPEWIEIEKDLSLLFIVGLGMARQVGTVKRVTTALAEKCQYTHDESRLNRVQHDVCY